jgi:DNA invertase Pin-like site-specific DNA recombinase
MKITMKIVAYYRVSTRRQGESGLGLEAQQAALAVFANQHCGSIIAEYREVETGKNSGRPILKQALQHAKQAGATLVVAKLDRLARNVAFTSTLMEAGVPFVCCDNPHATPLTIHILAAVAEDEARRISDRTKAALAAAKARGTKLGCANPVISAALAGRRGWEKASAQGLAVRARLQRERYGSIIPLIQELKASGQTFRQIADALNRQGFTTSRGKAFTNSQVQRVLARQICLTS